MATMVMMSNISISNSRNTEKIRLELDQLHSEALHTRSKANSARLRLIRLSKTAENLRQQAAISVQAGREDDARDLLYQKKKVLNALEKSNARIQLLDELSFKLNEAISANETRLIEDVASELDGFTEDASCSTVRIVSPKIEDTNLNANEITVVEELQTPENKINQRVYTSENDFSDKLVECIQNESYEEFMLNIGQQLKLIERELDTVLRVSSLVLGEDEKLKNLRVQQILDILEGVHDIRERISKITLTKTDYTNID